MRIWKSPGVCKRWFITFDGSECEPVPIDGVVYTETTDDMHRTRSIIGHCEIQRSGTIKVALNLGHCDQGKRHGDAMGGWNSSTRIYIEEIDPPQ